MSLPLKILCGIGQSMILALILGGIILFHNSPKFRTCILFLRRVSHIAGFH